MTAAPNRSPMSLSGRHILIVEDEMLIALTLCDVVASFGCTTAAASRAARAVSLATTGRFDAAIVDMNLAGESGNPVAEALARRGIPFVIATGYGTEGVAPDYRDRPLLIKPYLAEHVEAALLKVLA